MDKANKARVTITVKGKNLETLDKMVAATGKLRGDIIAELVSEVLEGVTPALEAKDELSAYKALFRESLAKLADTFAD